MANPSDMAGVSSLLAGGEQVGGQAQGGILLQLLTRIVLALEASASSPFTVSPYTAAGNLNIGTAYPNLPSGTFSIRQTVPAAIDVTLPTGGGPWTISDGSGTAAAHNITVKPPVGYTIIGTTTDVINTNWASRTYLLDGTNYIRG